ncbi:phosphoribosylanthranilate isomerase [Oscillatoria acuminata]|uniref:N-(5'-phosphoribosyl)anthranilate isomerase n=1 Tax=Oscillatoria acuminata PCC 6304 TaxID=56110 RepID=K9TGR9_9CYAN|nr:phosphoribosylanthranilate isomerase [Oscillatoria acuminata]AFY81735.1 phosphoribosylanthranilate isomerase [Oscillatoria acuminata PCC 6304]
MRVKICGITKPEQGVAIANLGATALGFICVPTSPRYVTDLQIQQMVQALDGLLIDRIGVFAHTTTEIICQTVEVGRLTGVQLHGEESVEFCDRLRQGLPEGVEILKAIRVKAATDLDKAKDYLPVVDTLLLDAYHPGLLGGTGQTLDWNLLQQFKPGCPWLLAGGLTPENIQGAIAQVKPPGIDLSSGVERSPGDKDLAKVAELFFKLKLSVS